VISGIGEIKKIRKNPKLELDGKNKKG